MKTDLTWFEAEEAKDQVARVLLPSVAVVINVRVANAWMTHHPGVEDLLPYQRTRVAAQEGSKEGQGPSRHQETYVNNNKVALTPQGWSEFFHAAAVH
jgi:hypothetical protein